jgi:hypothetical protein
VLTNDSDLVIKNNASQYISTFPITSTAKLYKGNTELTSGVTYSWKLGSTEKSTSQTLTLESTNYSAGDYIVTATYEYDSKTYTKTFSVKETTAEVDYDLIYPSPVNISTGAQTIAVQVLKTGKGHAKDSNDTKTLNAKGNYPIKI